MNNTFRSETLILSGKLEGDIDKGYPGAYD